MTIAARLVLPALLLISAVAQAEPTVLVLRRPGFTAEERAVVRALRIYERDLGCRILDDGEPSLTPGTDDLKAIAAEGLRRSAGVVVWADWRDGGRTLYGLDAVTLDLRESEIEPVGLDAAAQTLALKVRTLLLDGAARGPADPAPGSSGPGGTTTEGTGQPGGATGPPGGAADQPGAATQPGGATQPPSAHGAAQRPSAHGATGTRTAARPTASPAASDPTAGAAAGRASARPTAASHRTGGGGAAALTVAAGAKRRSRGDWLDLGVGYGLVVPLDPAWIRHGLVLGAQARLPRLPIVLHVDGALTAQPVRTVGDFRVKLADLPFGLGAALAWRRDRVRLALGPRAGLHFLQISADSADAKTGGVRRTAVGLGAIARLEIGLGKGFGIWAGTTAELLVPNHEFTVEREPAVTPGALLFGITTGLSFTLP